MKKFSKSLKATLLKNKLKTSLLDIKESGKGKVVLVQANEEEDLKCLLDLTDALLENGYNLTSGITMNVINYRSPLVKYNACFLKK